MRLQTHLCVTYSMSSVIINIVLPHLIYLKYDVINLHSKRAAKVMRILHLSDESGIN
jgi:hypothetical protein